MPQNPVAGYQPQGALAQMLQARQQQRSQQITAKIMNEEMEAGLGAGPSVNVGEAVPTAYFNAARRLTALGDAQGAQALYQQGIAAKDHFGAQAVEHDRLRAATRQDDEKPGTFLPVLQERDQTVASLARFPEGSATHSALTQRLSILDAQLAQAGGNQAAPPREIALARQFNIDRTDRHQPLTTAEEVFNADNRTSARTQDYTNYVRDEQAAGRTPKEYKNWTPGFQGDISASTTLGGEGVKGLFELENKAYESVASLRTVQNSINLLNEGVRTGPGVEARQYAARAFAEFFGEDPSQATVNTDAYMAAAGPRVLAVARALAPVTELDLTRVEQIVGAGLGNASPESLRETLKIVAGAQTAIAERYNTRLSGLGERYSDVNTFKPVRIPEINFEKPEAPPTRKPVGDMTREELEAELNE